QPAPAVVVPVSALEAPGKGVPVGSEPATLHDLEGVTRPRPKLRHAATVGLTCADQQFLRRRCAAVYSGARAGASTRQGTSLATPSGRELDEQRSNGAAEAPSPRRMGRVGCGTSDSRSP